MTKNVFTDRKIETKQTNDIFIQDDMVINTNDIESINDQEMTFKNQDGTERKVTRKVYNFFGGKGQQYTTKEGTIATTQKLLVPVTVDEQINMVYANSKNPKMKIKKTGTGINTRYLVFAVP